MNKLLFSFFLFAAGVSIKGQKTPVTNHVERSIQQLHLDILKELVEFDVALYGMVPDNLEETIVIIPETVNEEEGEYELNTNIFIIDNRTGKVLHKYFESSKINGWTSDAIFIDHIAIDTTSYKLTANKNAFGILVTWRSNSLPNPYKEEKRSLCEKEKDTFKKESFLCHMTPILRWMKR